MKKFTQRIILTGLLSMMICSTIQAQTFLADPECPCYESIRALEEAYYSKDDSKFKELMDSAFNNMKQLPSEYPDGNPWIGKMFSDLVIFLNGWCTFLPTASGSHDTGLQNIQKFAWFYYQNPYGVDFVQNSPGLEIMQDFAKQRGTFMDSEASTTQIAEWLNDDRIEKEDYNLPDPDAPDGGFKSFNEFFSRTLKDQDKSRPQTMPDRDYVISAPTDIILNTIPQEITDASTLIPTKGFQALNISDMLDGSEYAEKFIGGKALSCVLMPNTYHHYHSPVSGHVVEAKIIEDAYYGYDNFPVWARDGNVGYYGTDFSQFGNFKRGYFIVNTGKYGHVAVIPVGLNTISSIIFKERFANITKPVPVKRGDELGHFLYGGSLVILIFESDKYNSSALRVRLGNQIGLFDEK